MHIVQPWFTRQLDRCWFCPHLACLNHCCQRHATDEYLSKIADAALVQAAVDAERF